MGLLFQNNTQGLWLKFNGQMLAKQHMQQASFDAKQ